jgi:cell wall-associated NlpC family hydrolase
VHELSSSRRSRLSAGTGKIALTLGLCLCAGQLVGTPAIASPTATSVTVAASTTTFGAAVKPRLKPKPRVTIRANRRTIRYGTIVRLTARIVDSRTKKAVSGGKVRFQVYRKGHWRTSTTRTVSSAGVATWRVRPHLTTRFRTMFTGSKSYRGAGSKLVRIAVRQTGNKVIAEAKRHRGARYVFGAAGPRVFDCSGYTSYVFRKALGKRLPHKANAQQRYGKGVAKSRARVGDLIVFRSGSYGYHAGIYAGHGYMWDPPRPGKSVGKHKIWTHSYVVRRLA